MDWIAALEREGHALSVAARHDPMAEVPSCPGWNVDELLRHTSVTHRWSERILRERLMKRPELEHPPGHDSLSWYEAGLAALLETMRAIDPTTSVWTFGPDRTATFWFRRQAHETAVHRVDAEQATGVVHPFDPAFAADGIAESLETMVPRMMRISPVPAGGTLHLHTTDAEGEWLLHFGEGQVEVEVGHAKGDAAVRGTAHDLYLWMWGRDDGAGLERFGDAELPERLLRLTRV
jgi:uncharacterized protein (TIGR03083 family)